MRGFISQPENQKLLSIIGLLSSTNDGERSNAFDALTKELAKRDMDLGEVMRRGLILSNDRPPQPAMPSFEISSWWKRDASLAVMRGGLSEWEHKFCASIKQSRTEPTPKQRNILKDIRSRSKVGEAA